VCSTAFAQIQEAVRIPAPGGYTVAATILRPEGPGPFGAVILNHGVPVSDKERAGASSSDLLASAAVFAQRGYVVVLPLRRGFGATGGEFAEYTGSCSHPDYLGGEQAAAEDVMAAYEYARALPYVDPHRMILAGHSAGGMVALFTAGVRQPEGLVAVLAFAAGRGGNPALHPGVPCAAALPPAVRAPSTCCSRRSATTATTCSATGRGSATGYRRWRASSPGTAFRSSARIPPRRSAGNQAGTGSFSRGFDSAGLAGVSGLACFLSSSALCRALRASSARRW